MSPHLQIFQVCVPQLRGGIEDLEPRRTKWKRVSKGKEMLGDPGEEEAHRLTKAETWETPAWEPPQPAALGWP